jgi:hypothetical protein
LTADFADAMPADEDPMPINGNPHQLPGNLQPMLHNFVLPPFPELGWNEVPPPQAPEDHNAPHDVQMEEVVVDPVEEVVSDQIVFDDSADTASSSAQVQNVGLPNFGEVVQPPPQIHIVNMMRVFLHNNPVRDIVPYAPFDLHTIFFKEDSIKKSSSVTVMGPVLPPDMIWSKVFASWLPEIMTASIPIAFRSCPFNAIVQGKRSWADAFQQFNGLALSRSAQTPSFCRPARRMVARSLNFSIEEEDAFGNDSGDSLPPVFASSPVSTVKRKTRGKAKKYDTPLVDTSVRRCTRSMIKNNGYRPPPVSDGGRTNAKRAKPQMKEVKEKERKLADNLEKEEPLLPQTPVHILQAIGIGLGIDPAKLTEEKLNASPAVRKKLPPSDD